MTIKESYKVVAIMKKGFGLSVLLKEEFKTTLEAETFIGIEGTQMEAEYVKEFLVVEVRK